jgi:hypothetical protein
LPHISLSLAVLPCLFSAYTHTHTHNACASLAHIYIIHSYLFGLNINLHIRQPYSAFTSCNQAYAYIPGYSAHKFIGCTPFSMSFTHMDVLNTHLLPPKDLTTILMTSLIGIFLTMLPSLHGNNQQRNHSFSSVTKEIHNSTFQMCSNCTTQGSKITIPVSLLSTNHSWSTNLFQGNPLLNSFLLLPYHTKPYSYDCHSPLDVSLTHWSSRNALALPLSDLI